MPEEVGTGWEEQPAVEVLHRQQRTTALPPAHGAHEQRLEVTGFAGVAAWGFSPLAQKMFGRLVDRTGSFDAGLAVAGVLPLAALLCLLLFWNPKTITTFPDNS